MARFRVTLAVPGIYLDGHPRGQQVVDHLDVYTDTAEHAREHVQQVVLWPPRADPALALIQGVQLVEA